MSELIEKAIEDRLVRFDNLYEKATGHTFREDEAWCKGKTEEEKEAWAEKMKEFLEKHEIEDLETYKNSGKRIDEIDNHIRAVPMYTSLYPYEMLCINQAKAITDFIESLFEKEPTHQDIKDWWDNLVVDSGIASDMYKIVDFLKEKGFDKWDENHSGNSACASLMFAHCLIENPELFKYMHGALAPLAGDEGYHDDRSDVPNFENNELS